MSVRANKDTFESEINEAGKLVIADFYSDSCVPCKRMSPLLAETEEENPEGIKLVKLNINFDGETAQKYNVTSVPTLVFFKDGAEKARLTGAVKKAQLTETINSIDKGEMDMTITVAGNKKDVAEGLTVAQLVIDENVETPQYVTVTINDEFVESGAFESTVLKDGDVVEFLYFMGGGQ